MENSNRYNYRGDYHNKADKKGSFAGGGGEWKAGKSKRVRTIFTPEQLERMEAEFERQQYMVGTERYYLAASLNLTEAQVKVWFQNRRIKWRKQNLEQQHAKLAKLDLLAKHADHDEDDDEITDDSENEANLLSDPPHLYNVTEQETIIANNVVDVTKPENRDINMGLLSKVTDCEVTEGHKSGSSSDNDITVDQMLQSRNQRDCPIN